jgi:fatty-acyl-CoA synthase
VSRFTETMFDEVDADLLAVLRRAVPSAKGRTRVSRVWADRCRACRCASSTRILTCYLPAQLVDRSAEAPVTMGYKTVAGYVAAQESQGWYDTGDLGYLTEAGEVVVCGRLKDVIIMAGRNIYPTDIERAATRVDGVRAGCAGAVRRNAGHLRETFAVAVESKACGDHDEEQRIARHVAHEVVAEVNVRPRNVVVLKPGMIPKTPSGKLRRAHAVSLVD